MRRKIRAGAVQVQGGQEGVGHVGMHLGAWWVGLGAVPVYACNTLAQQYRKPFERGWVMRWMWGGKAKARYAGHLLFSRQAGQCWLHHCGKHRLNRESTDNGRAGTVRQQGTQGDKREKGGRLSARCTAPRSMDGAHAARGSVKRIVQSNETQAGCSKCSGDAPFIGALLCE